jgi:hypothetical protein
VLRFETDLTDGSWVSLRGWAVTYSGTKRCTVRKSRSAQKQVSRIRLGRLCEIPALRDALGKCKPLPNEADRPTPDANALSGRALSRIRCVSSDRRCGFVPLGVYAKIHDPKRFGCQFRVDDKGRHGHAVIQSFCHPAPPPMSHPHLAHVFR